MQYRVIACTDKAYIGWQVSIARLHKGQLKVTRNDGATATFLVDTIIKGPVVTLANSNFVAQLEAL